MANLVLDINEMRETFFADAAMIGIAAAQPGYRLCWLLNNHFDINFVSVPEQTICMIVNKGGKETVKSITETMQGFAFPDAANEKEEQYFFPTYLHSLPNSCYKYMLYQLKCGKKELLPEAKHLDYLWLIQTAEPEHDKHTILEQLRQVPEVQLAQELTTVHLKKSITNLLV